MYKFPKIFGRNRGSVRARIVLKDGYELDASISPSEVVSVEDLTAKVVWKFVSWSGRSKFFVLGDNISYIEVQAQ